MSPRPDIMSVLAKVDSIATMLVRDVFTKALLDMDGEFVGLPVSDDIAHRRILDESKRAAARARARRGIH